MKVLKKFFKGKFVLFIVGLITLIVGAVGGYFVGQHQAQSQQTNFRNQMMPNGGGFGGRTGSSGANGAPDAKSGATSGSNSSASDGSTGSSSSTTSSSGTTGV